MTWIQFLITATNLNETLPTLHCLNKVKTKSPEIVIFYIHGLYPIHHQIKVVDEGWKLIWAKQLHLEWTRRVSKTFRSASVCSLPWLRLLNVGSHSLLAAEINADHQLWASCLGCRFIILVIHSVSIASICRVQNKIRIGPNDVL